VIAEIKETFQTGDVSVIFIGMFVAKLYEEYFLLLKKEHWETAISIPKFYVMVFTLHNRFSFNLLLVGSVILNIVMCVLFIILN